MNQLVTSSSLDELDQLSLITEVRKQFSLSMDEVDVQRVLKETNILSVVNNCLSIQDDIHPIIRYIKLEATWILTNIGYGNEEDIMEIFGDEYKFIDHINRILKGNDLQMIDQVYFFLTNVMFESKELTHFC